MTKEDILYCLYCLSSSLSVHHISDGAYLYLAGGSAMTLWGLNRAAAEVNALNYSSGLNKLFIYHRISTVASLYGDFFPEDYKSRAKEIDIGANNLKRYVLSKEDVAIAKMCSTRGGRDIDDVNALFDSGLDIPLMDRLVENMRTTVFSSSVYESLVKRYRLFKEKPGSIEAIRKLLALCLSNNLLHFPDEGRGRTEKSRRESARGIQKNTRFRILEF